MFQAGVLNVLVTASTGQANAALRTTQAQFKETAATANSSAAATSGAWKKAAVGIAVLGIGAMKMATDFDQAMTLVETQAGAPVGEIKRLRGEVLELAKASEFSPKELADGLFRVESAGYRGAEAMKTLDAAQELASVGQSDLEQTTAALTAAMRSGIAGTETAAKTVGTLNAAVGQGSMRMEDLVGALSTGILPAAKSFGLGLQDVTAALDLMTRTGVPANSAATRLRMTFSLMAAPTDSAKKALQGIGLDATDLAKAMRGPEGLVGAVELLRSHLDKLSKVKQAQVISQAFGGGRTSAGITAMVQNVEDLKDIYKETTKTQTEFHEKAEQQAATASAKFQTAWNNVQVMLIDLGTYLEGPLSDAATMAVGALQGVVGVLGHIPSSTAVAAAAIVGTGAALLGVVKIIGFFVGMARTVILTVGVMEGAFAVATAEAGVLAGAIEALNVAIAASPFGVAIVGAVALLGAYEGVKAISDSLSDSTENLTDNQILLQQTTERAKGALKEEHMAMKGLHSTTKRSKEAHEAEKKATHGVLVAHENLVAAQAKYPAQSKPVLDAKRDLLIATRKETRAEKAAERASHAHHRMLATTKRAMEASVSADQARSDALQHQYHHLTKLAAGETKRQLNDKQTIRVTNRLDHVEKQLNSTEKDRQEVIKKANEEFGPHFANVLDKMSDGIIKVKRSTVDMSNDLHRKMIPSFAQTHDKLDIVGGDFVQLQTAMRDRFMPWIVRGGRTMGGFRTTTEHASDKLTDFKKTGVGATDAVGHHADLLLGNLGIGSKGFSFKDSNKKARGGMLVPGSGPGDKVPFQALLEPGEMVHILNRNATNQLKALETANANWPRFQRGGILEQALGPYTIPPIQYDPGHAGSNSHLHLDFFKNSQTVAFGKRLQQMGWSIGEYSGPAVKGFGPITTQHQSPGHYDGTAFDANTAADETRQQVAQVARMLGGASGIAAISLIKKILIKGPGGDLKTAAQAAEEVVRHAYNEKLKSLSSRVGVVDAPGDVSGSGINSASEFIPFWKKLNPDVAWAAGAFSKIVPRESTWNPRASNGSHRGWYQFDSATWQDFGSGSWDNAFNPVAATLAAGAVARQEGRSGIMSRWAQTFSGWQKGGLGKAEHLNKRLKGAVHKIARLDEFIDIAQRRGELGSGPGGTELTAQEIAQQVDLNSKLLDNLRKELGISKQGEGVTKHAIREFKHGQDHQLKSLKSKLHALHARHKRIAKSQHGLKHPNPNATNSTDREIEKTQRALDKRKDELQKEISKLKDLHSTFHQARVDMAGVTGGGGRIFDTKLTLDDLRHTASGGGGLTGISLDQLLGFAEAMRYGAFQHQLPSFHDGGVYRAPTGQNEGLAILKDKEVVLDANKIEYGRSGDLVVVFEARDPQAKWLLGQLDAHLERKDSRSEKTYRARSR